MTILYTGNLFLLLRCYTIWPQTIWMFLSLYIKSALGQQDKVQVTYFLYQELVQNIIKDLLRYLQLLCGIIYQSLLEIVETCLLLRQLI